MTTPRTMAQVSSSAERTESKKPPAVPTKNMVRTAIKVGNLPLQGTKLFVSMASSRSLGESMMRQPMTPAALQPNPMHMVSACLPQAQHRLNGLSRLYAMRGRYPASSSRVNSGKKIAIGGSITETTQARTR